MKRDAPTESQEPEIFTSAEVGRRVEPPLTAGRIRQLADGGVIPCMRTETGRRIFRRADVEAFVASRATSPGPRQSNAVPQPAARRIER